MPVAAQPPDAAPPSAPPVRPSATVPALPEPTVEEPIILDQSAVVKPVPLPPPLPAVSQTVPPSLPLPDSCWYYRAGGNQFGPVSEEEVWHLLDRGTIRPTDMVWKAGLQTWIQIEQCLTFREPSFQRNRQPSENNDRPGNWRGGQIAMLVIGAVLAVGGLFSTISFANMDTSVWPEHGRYKVHNIGLLAERQNGLIVSLVFLFLGFALCAVGWFTHLYASQRHRDQERGRVYRD